jgi:uncharacterized protein YceK
MKLLICLTVALTLGGCATTVRRPSPEAVAAATFSPVPADIEGRIKAQYQVMLKDPYSAVYQFGAPRRAYFRGPSGMVYGYMVAVHVNAKNSYGGYTGGELYHWGWADGVLLNATNTVKFGGAAFID